MLKCHEWFSSGDGHGESSFPIAKVSFVKTWQCRFFFFFSWVVWYGTVVIIAGGRKKFESGMDHFGVSFPRSPRIYVWWNGGWQLAHSERSLKESNPQAITKVNGDRLASELLDRSEQWWGWEWKGIHVMIVQPTMIVLCLPKFLLTPLSTYERIPL